MRKYIRHSSAMTCLHSVVAGYVDDTTIVGRQTDSRWIQEVFQNIKKWKTAGIVMDTHHCWQVGFSSRALDENTLYKVEDVWSYVTPIHELGQATCSAALQHVPGYARRFVLRHGDHCMHMASDAIPRLVTEGHPMLCRLAAVHANVDPKRNCSRMSVILQSNYIVWTKLA